MANQEASTPPKTKRKLTAKQLKFIKAKAAGKTGVEAAKEAYPGVDYASANAIAVQNLQKLSIQDALNAEFEKQGITLQRIVKPIGDALDAQRVVIVGNGDDAFADVQEDHSVRLKAAGMAAQWMGIGRQIETGGGIHFHNHTDNVRSDYGI